MSLLTREQILDALGRLDRELARIGIRAEIYVVGGAALCIALEARPATKDVDAFFTEPQAVREAARRVAEDMSLPEDWLNDAAKAFIPKNARFESYCSWSNLDVAIADEETLLAMKCAAARTDQDRKDIRFLVDRLQIKTPNEVLSLVLRYYPKEQLPIRTELLVEEIFDDNGA